MSSWRLVVRNVSTGIGLGITYGIVAWLLHRWFKCEPSALVFEAFALQVLAAVYGKKHDEQINRIVVPVGIAFTLLTSWLFFSK